MLNISLLLLQTFIFLYLELYEYIAYQIIL